MRNVLGVFFLPLPTLRYTYTHLHYQLYPVSQSLTVDRRDRESAPRCISNMLLHSIRQYRSELRHYIPYVSIHPCRANTFTYLIYLRLACSTPQWPCTIDARGTEREDHREQQAAATDRSARGLPAPERARYIQPRDLTRARLPVRIFGKSARIHIHTRERVYRCVYI